MAGLVPATHAVVAAADAGRLRLISDVLALGFEVSTTTSFRPSIFSRNSIYPMPVRSSTRRRQPSTFQGAPDYLLRCDYGALLLNPFRLRDYGDYGDSLLNPGLLLSPSHSTPGPTNCVHGQCHGNAGRPIRAALNTSTVLKQNPPLRCRRGGKAKGRWRPRRRGVPAL
jgi:hypothetical protein